MTPSNRILEHNLQRLFERSYRPVLPAEEFVRRLEGELAPWLGEPVGLGAGALRPVRGRGPLWAALLAAAGLLFLWFALKGGSPRPSSEPLVGLETCLARGEVALRVGAGGWRAATPDELELGINWQGSRLELATPRERGVLLVDGERWRLELGSESRLRVELVDGVMRFELERGRVSAQDGRVPLEYDAPAEFRWSAGRFSSAGREPLVTRREDLGGASGEAAPDEPTVVPTEPASAATLRGRALELASGEALVEFDVSLLRSVSLPSVSMPETTHFAGGTGEFEITGLVPGQYSLFLQAPGYAVWKLSSFVLRAGEILELEPRVERGGSVRGYVVDRESGAAVAGALVVAELDIPMQIVSLDEVEFPEEVRAYTHTAQDGSFTLEHLCSGPQRLRASGPGHAPTWMDEFELQPGGERGDLLIELGPGGGVHGLVQRADGEPWSGARVVISRFDPGGGMGTMTYRGLWTDEQGRFEAVHLAPGLYVVLMFGEVSEEQGYGAPEYTSVQVREGGSVQADFLSAELGTTVSGVVRDADGEPLQGVNVQLHRGSAGFRAGVSNADGVYSVGLESGGRYELFAGVGDSAVRVGTLRVVGGEVTQHDFVLAGETLRIDVRAERSGERVQGVGLFLFPKGATTRTRLADVGELCAQTWGGVGGEYVIGDVPAGEYDLLAVTESGEYAGTLLEGVRVMEGEEARVVMDLPRGGSARVEVVDEEGQPVAGARVRWVHPWGRKWGFWGETRTDEGGVLRVKGLLPGEWGGSVRAVGCEKVEFRVGVSAGGESVVRMSVARRR